MILHVENFDPLKIRLSNNLRERATREKQGIIIAKHDPTENDLTQCMKNF